MGEHGLPMEVVNHCLNHLSSESLAKCLLVSPLFWKLSRPLVFRELQVRLRLRGTLPGEIPRDLRCLARLMYLLHPDDVHYSIGPLVRVLVLKIELGIHGHAPSEAELLAVVQLLVMCNLSSLSLTWDGHSTGPHRLSLKQGLVRLIRQPTLRHLSLSLMKDLSFDIFNNLNLESLDLTGCFIPSTHERFVALPLKRCRTDHLFPFFAIYSKPSSQTTYGDPPPTPYSSLVRYEAESYPYELRVDIEIVQRSFRTLQVLSFVIEGLIEPTIASLDLSQFLCLQRVKIDYKRDESQFGIPSDLPNLCQAFFRPSGTTSLRVLSLNIRICDDFERYLSLSPESRLHWLALDQALTQPNLSASASLGLQYTIWYENRSIHEINLSKLLLPTIRDLLPQITQKNLLTSRLEALPNHL